MDNVQIAVLFLIVAFLVAVCFAGGVVLLAHWRDTRRLHERYRKTHGLKLK